MARNVTLQDIVDRARVHADMRQSAFISDTTALLMLNEIYPRLYDELVSADAGYYEATPVTYGISSASSTYALPSDFYKATGMDFTTNGSTYYTLFPYNDAERNTGFSPASLPSGTLRLRYIPAPTTFTALTQTIDGISGWDRLLSLMLAIDMLDAEESNTDRVYRKYQEELRRVQNMAPNRDMGMPGTVTDVYASVYNGIYNWVRYRLRGGNIDLISTCYITAGPS